MENEYKQPYYTLFAALEDIAEAIDKHNFGIAKDLIVKAQLAAEKQYIEFGEN